jgi:hypothetical protein
MGNFTTTARRLLTGSTNPFKDVAEAGVGIVQTVNNKSFKVTENPKAFLGIDFKATGFGKAWMSTALIAGGIGDAISSEEQSWNGVADNRIQYATPSLSEYQDPSYMNNGSADGNLVFALYKNRMG